MLDASDEELMLAYVDGDKTAFRELFSRYSPRLFRMAMRHMRNEDLARDLVQQTFFRLHRARHDFKRDAKLSPWITTIGMNLIREHWRRSSKRHFYEFDPALHGERDDSDEKIEKAERALSLTRALAKLPDNQREVVELHWFQEHSFREVAQMVGSTEGAVRVRAHRAYKRLQAILDEKVDR